MNISQVVYTFSKDNAPAARVNAPATVTFETRDCYDGLTPAAYNPDKINPSTGPLYIEGAHPGDTLKVTIESINLAPGGVVKAGGILKHMIDGLYWHHVPVAGDYADFNGRNLPLNKMVGVIGVAPAGEAVPTSTPGPHGSNMDTASIGEGSVLYLPVQVEGALLAMGDVHALMGDGEAGGTGLEIAASVRVCVEVIPGAINWPLVDDGANIAAIASAKTLDEAANLATEEMCRVLEVHTGLPRHDAAMLMSLAGNLRICQVVNPLKTVRFEFPKNLI